MSLDLQFFLFTSLPLALTLLVLKSYFFSSKSNKNLPPSPPKLPLIGNLHQLATGMHRELASMAETHGQLMLIHLGTVPTVIASSANAAREIMKTHDKIFANRPFLDIGNRLTYGSKDIAFAQYGEQWRHLKSISVLHLLSHKRVQSFRQVREDEVALIIKKIQGAHGSVFNLSDLLISLSNNMICRVALGKRYEGSEAKNLNEKLKSIFGRVHIGTFIPMLKWVDKLSGLLRDAEEFAKENDEFYEAIIVEHEKKKELGGQRQDLVDILLEIQRDNSSGFHLERDMIKAIVIDMFGAGTDTTFSNLEWAMSELLRNPRAMKELQQEAHKIGQGRSMIPEEDMDKMPYLKATMKEILRMHPPIPLLVPRESTKDVKLFGYDIPSGTQVIINAWAIGRDPSIWEDPHEFRPERFLNSPIDYKGFHFELIPFGAGRRGCPGISFAATLVELAVANLVYKFDFALQGKESWDMSEADGMNVHKKFPILVTTTPYE